MQRLHLGRLFFAIPVAIYAVVCAVDPATFRFLDRVDLIFHEAGHFILRPFGQFIHMLGGTLGQLFFPLACTIYFWRSNQRFAASVTAFWIGQSLFNISVYMKDAQVQQLPLLGGPGVIHDWFWLFRKMGLLNNCVSIGNMTYTVGLLFVIASIAGMAFFSFKQPEDKPYPEI